MLKIVMNLWTGMSKRARVIRLKGFLLGLVRKFRVAMSNNWDVASVRKEMI